MNIKVLLSVLAFGAVIPFAGAQNVWHFNADSCKVRALTSNNAMTEADLNVKAAKEVKKAAFTKYFPTVQASVSAFVLQDYLLDMSVSEISDGEFSLDIKHNGQDLSVYFNEFMDKLAPFFASFGIDIYEEYNKFVSGLSYDASLKMVKDGIFGTVTAMQPVYAGGRIVNGNKLASLGVKAAELQKSLTEKDVRHETEKRYWLLVSLIEKQKTLDVLNELLDTLNRDVEVAYEASLITKNDVLKVRLKLNEVMAAKSTLASGIVLANMSLCQYVGLPLGDKIVPADVTEDMAQLPSLPVIPDSTDVSMRDEFRLLQLNADAEKLKKRMVLGEALPQLAVGAGYAYSNLWGANKLNGGLFVTLNVPLTAWWENAHNYRKQKIQEQIALNKRNEYSQLLTLQIRQSWDEICTLLRQVDIYKETIAQAEENMRLSKDNYDAGLVSLSDYLESQALYRQSMDQYLDKCIEYKLKVLEYNQMINSL